MVVHRKMTAHRLLFCLLFTVPWNSMRPSKSTTTDLKKMLGRDTPGVLVVVTS